MFYKKSWFGLLWFSLLYCLLLSIICAISSNCVPVNVSLSVNKSSRDRFEPQKVISQCAFQMINFWNQPNSRRLPKFSDLKHKNS